jgi:hypothetical protein
VSAAAGPDCVNDQTGMKAKSKIADNTLI